LVLLAVDLVEESAAIIHLQFRLIAKAERNLLSFLRLGLRSYLLTPTQPGLQSSATRSVRSGF